MQIAARAEVKMEGWLKVQLLGGSAMFSGETLRPLTKKTRLLFAYLCLHAGHHVPRSSLKALLWSDRSEFQAAGSLRRSLADIRKFISENALPEVLGATSDTVRVHADAIEVDALDFERAAQARDECQLRNAAQSYGGDLLVGVSIPDPAFDEWLQVERERLRAMALDVCERLANTASEPQSWEAAEAMARRLLSQDPACEEAHRALILCFQRTGRTNAAVRQFSICSEALWTHLGVEPEERTKQLLETPGQPVTLPVTEVATISPGAERTQVSELRPDLSAPLANTDRPVIAVQPLANLAGVPDQTYFSDGLTEDIITELSRFSSLSVVARTSMFAYRDREIDSIEAGKVLGAQYILEGSVRKSGQRIRLTAQLVDTETGRRVWAERYDRTLDDIFEIQDELVHNIVSALPGQIEQSDRKRSIRKPAESLAAYDYYLRALEFERQYDRASIISGRKALERAVELDPGFARAHALLAFFTFAQQWFDDVTDGAALDKAVELGKRAIELDPNDNDCYAKLGTAYLSRCDYDQARHYLEQAIEMNPHDAWTWSHYAWLLTTIGEHEASLEYLGDREAIDPLPPNWHWETRGISEYSLGKYRDAAVTFNRIVGPCYWIRGLLAACLGQLGEHKEAKRQWAQMLRQQPGASIESVFAADSNTMQQAKDVAHWLEGVEKAGITDHLNAPT